MSTTVPDKKEPRQPPAFANSVAKFILSSPLHVLFSKNLLLLTFTGRKSGKLFTIPIGYQQKGKVVFCYTDHKWWKNLLAHPTVTLHLKGQALQGEAEVIHDDIEKVSSELGSYIEHSPMAARAFGVEVDEKKQPVPESLRYTAQNVAVIRISLNS